MKNKIRLLAACLAASALISPCAFAESEGASSTVRGQILEKLSKLEQKQDEILRKLEELKNELAIVKVRATLKS